jgi:hypothetical protein
MKRFWVGFDIEAVCSALLTNAADMAVAKGSSEAGRFNAVFIWE